MKLNKKKLAAMGVITTALTTIATAALAVTATVMPTIGVRLHDNIGDAGRNGPTGNVSVQVPCQIVAAGELHDLIVAPGYTPGFAADRFINTGSNAQVAPTCVSTNAAAAYAGTASTPPPPTTNRFGQTRSYNAGVPGNCTYGAYQWFFNAFGVYPALSGDAYNWDNSARATGWKVSLDAVPQSIVVFEPYAVSGIGALGHVAWVDSVETRSDGRYIHTTEMNAPGLGVVSRYIRKDVVGMSYITPN